MGIFENITGDETELIEIQKYDIATTMKLIRIIDWETQIVLYTDTSREGYTSVPFSEADISMEDAPENVTKILNKQN